MRRFRGVRAHLGSSASLPRVVGFAFRFRCVRPVLGCRAGLQGRLRDVGCPGRGRGRGVLDVVVVDVACGRRGGRGRGVSWSVSGRVVVAAWGLTWRGG